MIVQISLTRSSIAWLAADVFESDEELDASLAHLRESRASG